MPQQPDASFAPDIDVDDNRKYVAELVEIVEQPSTSQFKKTDAEMTMVHKFHLYDMDDGVAVIDNRTGEMYEQFWFRKDTTFHNKSTGQIGESREVANALLGKELTDDEVRQMIDEGWEQALLGKRVIMDLQWYTTMKGYQRLKPIRVKPYVRPKRDREAAAARGRRLDPEDDE